MSRFQWAILASLLFHALILSLDVARAPGVAGEPAARAGSRIEARLRTPPPRPPQSAPKTPPPARSPRVLALAPKPTQAPEPEKTWTRAERDEMSRFMEELAAENAPVAGRELARRALAMARTMTVPPLDPEEDARAVLQRLAAARVSPFTLDMYFDAVFRKMNRSAEMIGRRQRGHGTKAAAVRVVVNADGTLKSFRILYAADQQAEIDFIEAVVRQASPFPVFPADIRSATDTIVLNICIRPGMQGDSGGGLFSRMGEGERCG